MPTAPGPEQSIRRVTEPMGRDVDGSLGQDGDGDRCLAQTLRIHFRRMIEIETGSRAAFRGESVIDPDNAHTHGRAEHPRELTGADDEPVDAEIIDAEPMDTRRARTRRTRRLSAGIQPVHTGSPARPRSVAVRRGGQRGSGHATQRGSHPASTASLATRKVIV